MTEKFLWGSATAAYQCEGAWDADGKGPSIWDEFCHSEKNTTGITGDVSCDFFHHYQEDIRMMAEGGQNTYRFSISWSRIVPKADRVINEQGFEFYDNVLTECEKYGIVPNVTLVHYDLPDYVGAQGGWCWEGIVDEFAYYAAAVFRHFGDRIPLYVTINEPTHNASCCYMVGNYPPNHHVDFDRYFKTVYHEAVASAKAVKIYHDLQLGGEIGIVHDSSNVEVAPQTKEPERIKAIADLFYNRVILDGAILGELPGGLIPWLRENDIDTSYIRFEDTLTLAQGKIDFLGLNVYNRFYITDYSEGETEVFHNNKGAGSAAKEGIRIKNWYETTIDPTTKRNLWGREIYPRCMLNTLMEIKERYGEIPVYITENGHGCYETPNENGMVQDDERIEMMQGYIDFMFKAMEAGCDVRGYYAWSTMDLYSWVNGYEKRYGLVRVDFDNNCRRIPKKSYFWYQKLIQGFQNCIKEK